MAGTQANQGIPLFGHDENVTTCPHCGSRTDFMDRGETQLHWCLNNDCQFIFKTESDD